LICSSLSLSPSDSVAPPPSSSASQAAALANSAEAFSAAGASRIGVATLGARGRAIFVHAGRKIVVVHTAVHESLQQPDARREQFALWNNILEELAN
jgi:hypothetical protein